MQDGPDDLLRLGGLAFPEDTSANASHPHDQLEDNVVTCTGLNHLPEEDRISLSQLTPVENRWWCLSRIAELQVQNHNHLRQQNGAQAAARDAISTNNSHIRALRSAYNDAAPINQCLPPEVLIEVFSHVHPVVMPGPRVPLLHVCQYWRRLVLPVLKMPQFWANLLSLPTWQVWNPAYHMGHFRAALVRSASVNLDLFVPYHSKDIIDILKPHASRISSLAVDHALHNVSHPTFDFLLYPNVQSLELQHTYFHPPAAPFPSLRHLNLDHCGLRRSPIADGVPQLYAMQNALGSFPNLETLSLTCSLPHADPDGFQPALPAPDFTRTVYLPHLRSLKIRDVSDHIAHFISHLDFPSTTALRVMLEPTDGGDFSTLPVAVPLSPSFIPSPVSHAELSLLLTFRGHNYERFVRWETHGLDVCPVSVTLPGVTSNAPTIVRLSKLLVAALAPACALTRLTAVGSGARSTFGYWDALLPALPALRRLAYDAADWEDTRILIHQLEKTTARGCACPALEDVRVEWYLPYGVDYGSGPDLGEGGHWETLREHDDGGHREQGLLASLCTLSDTLKTCLVVRASDEGGRCRRLRKLEVRVFPSQFGARGAVLQGWQAALVEARLRDRLGEFVEDIVVVSGRVQ